jgi:hypothetical protein
MIRVRDLLLALAGTACASPPEKPIVPVDPTITAQVYDVTLAELKRVMSPAAGSSAPVNWSERMYLNPQVLLPPADSANPLNHDSQWMSQAVANGLVLGVCGKPPAQACPRDVPIAFTSLSPPWTQDGDTIYVQGGYAGEAPGAAKYEGVFWTFTLAPEEVGGPLKVVRKGTPTLVTFESN